MRNPLQIRTGRRVGRERTPLAGGPPVRAARLTFTAALAAACVAGCAPRKPPAVVADTPDAVVADTANDEQVRGAIARATDSLARADSARRAGGRDTAAVRCVADGRSGVPLADSSLGVPARAADLHGLVTAVVPPSGPRAALGIRVEEDPAAASGGAKAMVRVPATARVVQRVGHAAGPDLLRICQEVSVWFSGPVAESYPVQGTAAAIVIERVLARAP